MIHLDKLAHELGFEEEEVTMLIEMFLESAQDHMTTLQMAIDTKNYAQIKLDAHAIKGSAANLMLEDIYTITKEIEDAAIQQRDMHYNQMYMLLEKELHKLMVLEQSA